MTHAAWVSDHSATERNVFGLWKAFRGRRAAAGQIVPLVDGTRLRLGNIPDTAWHDPYVIGFLGMLITFIATRSIGPLDTDDLAAVQAGAWTDITGMPGDLVGEEICFLSASNDNRFILGCRNAESFARALAAAARQGERLDEGAAVSPSADLEVRSALWSRYFDAQLTEPSSAETYQHEFGS
jgi:hypothetical protein